MLVVGGFICYKDSTPKGVAEIPEGFNIGNISHRLTAPPEKEPAEQRIYIKPSKTA